MDGKEFYTIGELAKILKVSKSYLYELIKANKLSVVVLPTKGNRVKYRVSRKKVEECIKANSFEPLLIKTN